ncbi:MAG: serine/threonine-protein kinase, partial [Myxococcota bacterium]
MSGQSTERPRERTGGTDDGDVLDDRQAPTRPLAGAVTVPIAPDPIDASPGDLGMLQTEASEPRTRASGDAALSRGQQIGRYVVVDQLGAGGMGVVYRAFDPDLDRSVALKLVAVDSYDAADERSRLLREAQAMARLSHPNVIPVFDVGVEAKAVFVAMELVDGTTLTRWLAKTKPGWASIVAHFVEAGRGLSAAHAGGLIHRDFKPDNVMVGNDDRVRVLDFGLARGSAADAKIDDEDTAEFRSISASKLSGGSLDASMTADGTVMGTPAYMSPEQHMGIRVTAASDQFSFCVALWEALYGERPFAGDNLTVLTANVMQGKLRAVPAASEVPAWIHAAVVRGLSVDDDKRHSGMDALLQVLSHDPRHGARTVACCREVAAAFRQPTSLSRIGRTWRS